MAYPLPAEPTVEETPFVATVREFELAIVLELLRAHGAPSPACVLEIGGGAGWQARDLAAAGYRVRSVDIVSTPASAFPVERYDGRNLPFPDAVFDVVFSSNALEHVPHVEAFQAELRRVLKPSGIAIHLMPTPTWRLATSLAHYPWLARTALAMLIGRRDRDTENVHGAALKRPPLQLLSRVLFAPRHGETGNAVAELWLFSRWRWRALFQRHGWRVVEDRSNGLFYSGYVLVGRALPMSQRSALARIFGGGCRAYVLR